MINPGCLTGRRRPEEYHEPDEAFDRCEEVQTRSPHVRLERQRLARLSKCPHNRGGGRCANSMRTQEAERYMSAPFFVVFRFQATGTSIVPIAWIVSQIRDGLNGPLLTPFPSFDLVPFRAPDAWRERACFNASAPSIYLAARLGANRILMCLWEYLCAAFCDQLHICSW